MHPSRCPCFTSGSICRKTNGSNEDRPPEVIRGRESPWGSACVLSEDLRTAALAYHRLPRPGKLEIQATKPLANQRDLALAYSPGVAAACTEIANNPAEAASLTARANLVAVVSNGTAVLGLGNIGPLASKPVMEGKAVLFKKFAGIDVFDIEIAADTIERVVETVAALEPTFGGINRALIERLKQQDADGAAAIVADHVEGVGAAHHRADGRGQATRAEPVTEQRDAMTTTTRRSIADNVRTASSPSALRITDIRIATILGHGYYPILRIDTNQGVYGLGEVRDGASPDNALQLKHLLLGQNPCNVD